MMTWIKNISRHLIVGLDRMYFFNYLILILTSIGYFAYLYISGLKAGNVDLKTILHGSPYSAIMMIVVLVNLIVGYYLWQKKDDVLASRETARWTFWPLAVCQLLLGNIVNATISLLVYLSISERKLDNTKADASIKSLAIISSAFYILCLTLIISSMTRH
jgi:hypothetical protein